MIVKRWKLARRRAKSLTPEQTEAWHKFRDTYEKIDAPRSILLGKISEPMDVSGFRLTCYCCLPPNHEGECNPRNRMDQFPTPPRCGKPVVLEWVTSEAPPKPKYHVCSRMRAWQASKEGEDDELGSR